MEILRRFLKLFTHKSASNTATSPAKQHDDALPSSADLSEEPAADADYSEPLLRLRASCECAMAKATRPPQRLCGASRLVMPVLVPDWVMNSEDSAIARTYRGVVLTPKGLRYKELKYSNTLDIKHLFAEAHPDGVSFNPTENIAAAFDCILECNGNKVRNLVNITHKKHFTPKGMYMCLKTVNTDPNSPGDNLVLFHSYESNPDEDAAKKEITRFSRLRLKAYSNTFEGKPLTQQERIAINRETPAQILEHSGYALRGCALLDEAYINCQDAFFEYLNKLTENRASEKDTTDAARLSASMAMFHSKKGSLDRANFFANFSLWALNNRLPQWLNSDLNNSLRTIAKANYCAGTWARFKPTRLGTVLYNYYAVTPADIKDMLIMPASVAEPPYNVDPNDAWNFDFISAAKAYSDFTAFIAIGESTILTFNAHLNDKLVNTTFLHGWSFTDVAEDVNLNLAYPTEAYLSKEDFVDTRNAIAKDIVDEKISPSDVRHWLGRIEGAHLEYIRAGLAQEEGWTGEALYHLCRAQSIMIKARLEAADFDENDTALEYDVPVKIGAILKNSNRLIASLGCVSGIPTLEAFPVLVNSYTQLRDPRLAHLANAILADQEKLLLDSNYAAGKIDVSEAEIEEYKKQIDALRPFIPNPCFNQPLLGTYNPHLMNTAKQAKYYALIFAGDAEKAKLLINSTRITADADDMALIENETARHHGL